MTSLLLSLIKVAVLTGNFQGCKEPVRTSPKGGCMRNYEAACVFYADEAKFQEGKASVTASLTELGVQEMKEHDMGVRTLAFPIKKELQAHYLVFQFKAEPDQAHQIEDKVRYNQDLLRILVTRQED